MLKTFLIGLKDVRLVFRDRAALVFMLLAPFLLTVGMGFVTGRFSGTSNSGLSDIPVIIVNLDDAELGDALVDVFHSEDLADLMEPTASSDPEAARRLIDDNQAAAAVIIPAGFTQSIIPAEGAMFDPSAAEADPVSIEVYTNPAMPTSAGVVKAIVDEFVSRVEEGRTSGMTSIVQMLTTGVITPQQAESEGRGLFENVDQTESTALTLKTDSQGAQAVDFDVLAYMAPGMALLFLMYTVSYGGRSILAERAQGTLPRLLVSPTSATQILGGKVFGIYLTGVAQISILILASAVFFQVKWGDPLGMTSLDPGGGLRRDGLGHVDHRLRAQPKSGGEHRDGHHAHLWHPRRKFHQFGSDASRCTVHQQDHAQCLGVGRVHHPCPRRRPA